MSNHLVKFASFIWPTEAYLLQMRLTSEGIPCFIFDENMITMNWTYSNAIWGVKLYVNSADLEKAQEILNIDPDGEIDADEERCPLCNSADLKYSDFSRRLFFLSWLFIIFPLPYFKKERQCRSCGYKWIDKAEVKEDSEVQ